MDTTLLLEAARAGDRSGFGRLVEPHRRELLVHCYRMLGSLQDAEDLVQESLLRAWQKLGTYEGRASFRSWLYKIATNACLDALDRRPRRTLPPGRALSADPGAVPAPPVTEPIWLEPFPDDFLDEASPTPEARYDAHESITLAFLSALQAMPPRQRAVLILCDVLEWQADEAAQTLDITTGSVSSALHRARVTLAKSYRSGDLVSMSPEPTDERTRSLLERYVRAWENADIDALVALLKDDATFAMPPFPSWYRGKIAIRDFIRMEILAGPAQSRYRLEPTRANGRAAFGWYRLDDSDHRFHGFAIQVVGLEGELVSDITTFMNPALFERFALPDSMETRR